MEYTLNKAKLAIVALCGAITAVFGWLGWLVILFAACMALDWVTGSIAGTVRQWPALLCLTCIPF